MAPRCWFSRARKSTPKRAMSIRPQLAQAPLTCHLSLVASGGQTLRRLVDAVLIAGRQASASSREPAWRCGARCPRSWDGHGAAVAQPPWPRRPARRGTARSGGRLAVRKPGGDTYTNPLSGLPVKSMGRTYRRRMTASNSSSGIRTIRSLPTMPQHIRPRQRKARPPNILRSVMSCRTPNACRMRFASCSS